MIDDVEYWRTRCEIAERTLKGDDWGGAASGFTLTETRILKLLLRRDMSSHELADFLALDSERITDGAVKTHVCRCREKIGADVMPTALCGDRRYSLVDRDKVRRLLIRDDKP